VGRQNLNVVRAYINIEEKDKELLEKTYGWGWSASVRDLIHTHCNRLRDRARWKEEEANGQ